MIARDRPVVGLRPQRRIGGVSFSDCSIIVDVGGVLNIAEQRSMKFVNDVLVGRRPRSGDDDVSYMVIYGDPQGARELLELEELSAAIELVEQLRNEQEVHDVRLLETNELFFGFKPYYHVELSTPAAEASVAADEAESDHNWSQPADWATTDSTVEEPDAAVEEDTGSEMPPVSDDSTIPEPAIVGATVSAGEFSTAETASSDDSSGDLAGPAEDLVWGSSVTQATEISDAEESDDAPQRRGLFGR
ncbi:MAG: hypothetical protein IH940_07040 [Acidobacteria bacterium]|nr:hypothetical protein [Acidobacteriota bacterium]